MDSCTCKGTKCEYCDASQALRRLFSLYAKNKDCKNDLTKLIEHYPESFSLRISEKKVEKLETRWPRNKTREMVEFETQQYLVEVRMEFEEWPFFMKYINDPMILSLLQKVKVWWRPFKGTKAKAPTLNDLGDEELVSVKYRLEFWKKELKCWVSVLYGNVFSTCGYTCHKIAANIVRKLIDKDKAKGDKYALYADVIMGKIEDALKKANGPPEYCVNSDTVLVSVAKV